MANVHQSQFALKLICVIQIIEQSGQGEQQCAEAALLAGLSHPNIVVTYKVASRTRTVRFASLSNTHCVQMNGKRDDICTDHKDQLSVAIGHVS